MEGPKIGYQDWIVAAFLVMTSLKSVSSMKLHRDLGITQESAGFLAHRVRAALSEDAALFSGPIEVDETYMGGKSKALADKGRGPVGKTAVVGAKGRATRQVAAKVVESTDAGTMQGFVKDHADAGATVYTDDPTAYESFPFDHDSVKHPQQEYVKGDVLTNGIESLWSLLKGAHTAHSTGCRPSTWTVTCRNSPGGATCASWTPSIRSRGPARPRPRDRTLAQVSK